MKANIKKLTIDCSAILSYAKTAFFVCSIFLSSLIYSASAENLNENLGDADAPPTVFVTKDNWQNYAEYLLEPVAKNIALGNLELVGDLKVQKESELLDIPSHEAGLFEINRVVHTNAIQKRNNGILFLSSFAIEEPESSLNSSYFSAFLIAPESLKNWVYSLKLQSTKDKESFETEFVINSGISGCRKVYPENTEDELFASPISFNDLFFSSVANKSYREEILDRKTMFVPYVSDSQDSLSKDSLSAYDSEISSVIGSENCQLELADERSKVYSNNISGNRIEVRKRNVYIAKRRYQSPFYEEAFEILVLDIVNKLPYIRLIYNSDVDFQRAVFYQWGTTKQDDQPNGVLQADFRGLVSFDKSGKLIFNLRKLKSYSVFNESCVKAKVESICK